jgi:hypothetical protein
LGLSLLVWGGAILVYARMTEIAPALVLMGITGFLLSAAQVAETPLLMNATPQELQKSDQKAPGFSRGMNGPPRLTVCML